MGEGCAAPLRTVGSTSWHQRCQRFINAFFPTLFDMAVFEKEADDVDTLVDLFWDDANAFALFEGCSRQNANLISTHRIPSLFIS